MGIRIDALPPTAIPALDYEFPAMKGGLTVKLTLDQIRQALESRAWIMLASAATVDLLSSASEFVIITGTTTIVSFGVAPDGFSRNVRFSGVLTLTHNAASLILPTGANIVTAAGDHARFVSSGGGNWRCVSYQRADGTPLAIVIPPLSRSASQTTNGAGQYDFTGIPSTARRITILLSGVSLSGSDDLLVQIGTSGGVETTGYTSGSGASVNSTTGFIIRAGNATRAARGALRLHNITANIWVSDHSVGQGATADFSGGGDKGLAGTLDRVRITRTGTDTFDGGSAALLWE